MAWRSLQKLVRNGNSTQVTIPVELIRHLGWLPGEVVILELLEDKTIRVRYPTGDDFGPRRMPRLVFDDGTEVAR